MRRKLLGAFLAGALMVGVPAVAVAHHGPMHRAVYRQTVGPRWMPDAIVLRCPGWAEDVAGTLTMVGGTSSRPVYRCDLNV